MTATITSTDKNHHNARVGPWWRTWPVLGGGAVVAVVLGVWLIGGAMGGEGPAQDGPVYRVHRGSLTIHVTESGTIQAREQVVIKSEVQGQTTIIWLVEEGKHVKEGDLLVELDASKLQDNLVDQQIRVQNAEASFIRARENLEITRSKGESDVAKAELDYEFAQEDLKKYVEGEYPKELDELEAKIKLAESDLEDAQNTFEWSQKLFAEKYIAESDLTRDSLRLKRAELDLRTATANRDLLVMFTHKRRVRELESDVDQKRMALGRAKRQALANVVQDEADLKAKESELNRQKEKLAKNQDQISKTQIYSPAAGMVIYATTGRESRRGNDEPLEAGRMVREREELILLPTANSMLVNIKVHESSLKKVQVGQPVRITINALPGKVYWGKVAKIAPLPDAQSFWRGNPDLKVYNTEIYLDGELQGVRTGMTCKAQVIIQQLEDALFVPVQSVIRVVGKPTVYVQRGGKAVPVQVELGLDNKDYIHIVSGLVEGDRVLTNPPLDQVTNGRDAEADSDENLNTDVAETPAKPKDGAPSGGQTASPGDQAKQDGQGPPTAQQIAQMREKMKNMTPEQRKAFREKMQKQAPPRDSAGGDE